MSCSMCMWLFVFACFVFVARCICCLVVVVACSFFVVVVCRVMIVVGCCVLVDDILC